MKTTPLWALAAALTVFLLSSTDVLAQRGNPGPGQAVGQNTNRRQNGPRRVFSQQNNTNGRRLGQQGPAPGSNGRQRVLRTRDGRTVVVGGQPQPRRPVRPVVVVQPRRPVRPIQPVVVVRPRRQVRPIQPVVVARPQRQWYVKYHTTKWLHRDFRTLEDARVFASRMKGLGSEVKAYRRNGIIYVDYQMQQWHREVFTSQAAAEHCFHTMQGLQFDAHFGQG